MSIGVLFRNLRRRKVPPTDNDGNFLIGSEAFRAAAVFMDDGTLHVVPEHSKAVFAELEVLRRTWKLPRVRQRVADKPAGIEILYGRDGEARGRTQVENLERGARRFLGVLNEISALGASDIKFYMRNGMCDLRVRLANIEVNHGDQWPVRDAAQAIAWIYNERAAGDGSAAQQAGVHQAFAISPGSHVPLPGGVISMRGQKGPIMDGHDMLTLRLLYSKKGNEAGSLEMLGFDDDILEELARERRSENGLVIIGGSTGDGKSTTLVRQLERLYRERNEEVGINTVEDPIEYPIEGRGIAQMLVNSSVSGDERGEEFSKVLRHFLRSAPDVGMVSEIRTADAAREVLQFVISGHKIYTTIHSFSAISVPFRLLSLGVAPSEVAEPGVISLVMRQKLMPILCPHCARPATEAEKVMIADGLDNHVREHGYLPEPRDEDRFRPMIRNRAGCPACLEDKIGGLKTQLDAHGADRLDAAVSSATQAWGGLSRRRALAEYIRLDNTFRGFVYGRDPIGANAYWVKPVEDGGMGGRPLPLRIAALVGDGQVDFYDATMDNRLDKVAAQQQARIVGGFGAEEPDTSKKHGGAEATKPTDSDDCRKDGSDDKRSTGDGNTGGLSPRQAKRRRVARRKDVQVNAANSNRVGRATALKPDYPAKRIRRKRRRKR